MRNNSIIKGILVTIIYIVFLYVAVSVVGHAIDREYTFRMRMLDRVLTPAQRMDIMNQLRKEK